MVATCFPPCLTSFHLFHRIRRVPDALYAPSRVIWTRAPADEERSSPGEVSWRWNGRSNLSRRKRRSGQQIDGLMRRRPDTEVEMSPKPSE